MEIRPTDLDNPADVDALLKLMAEYSASDTGGSAELPDNVLQRLAVSLKSCPTFLGLIAWEGNDPVGLLNAFWSISTFKAKRLVNIHDIAVARSHQRKGIGRRLIRELNDIAKEMDCCKITLEVLDGNHGAIALYRLMGFESYQLDPAMGSAQFMQKWVE